MRDCGVTWTDWATLAASVGTVFLAGVAWYQAKQAKAQIALGRDQLEAAQEASEAAVDVHRESIRARVDQFAPRVSVHYGTVGGPFYSSARIRRTERDAELRDENMTLAAGMQFVLPRDGGNYIWFYGRALIVNHGDADARIRLPSQAHFIAGQSAFSGKNVDLPPFLEAGIANEAVLAPGQHALFQWSEGKSVSEWAKAAGAPDKPLPEGSIWLWTTVFDDRQDGIVDTLMAHLKPELLTAEQGSTDIWRVAKSKTHEMAPQPTHRGYRNEGSSVANLSQMYDYHGVDENGQSKDEPQSKSEDLLRKDNEDSGESSALAADQKKKWRIFVGISFAILIVVLVATAIVLLQEVSPIDNVWKLAKVPYWLVLLGTLTGAVGATKPGKATVPSKMRDRLALIGWVALLYGAAITVLYSEIL